MKLYKCRNETVFFITDIVVNKLECFLGKNNIFEQSQSLTT
jgi:hypothetical protein